MLEMQIAVKFSVDPYHGFRKKKQKTLEQTTRGKWHDSSSAENKNKQAELKPTQSLSETGYLLVRVSISTQKLSFTLDMPKSLVVFT